MQGRTEGSFGTTIIYLLVAAGMVWLPHMAGAAPVTFSGTVGYQGTHSGDTLYVAVLDTTGVEDVEFLDLKAFSVGSPPFSQAFSLDFDNAGVGAMLIVASFLDVDGGGVDSLTGVDVLGWYSGGPAPTGISSSTSQAGLDFDLPRAEIHGTVTFAPGQTSADIEVSDDPVCATEGFRPRVELTSPGAYSIIGVYAGTYCVKAQGFAGSGPLEVCFGDPTCQSPTGITLGQTEVRTGVDLDFTAAVPTEKTTWGRIKSQYP